MLYYKKILYSNIWLLFQGVYGDESSFSLIGEASVADLNNRLEEPVTPQNFRMNFCVKGAKAYEEDNWDWVKVGQVIFRNLRPCTRCIFTTVNPETGQKNPKVEPLKTLKGYDIKKQSVFCLVPFFFHTYFCLSNKKWSL